MTSALRELMTGLVDYAGLFPPAGLDMPTAAANYAAHRAGDAAWMLGGFILPADRLGELGAVLTDQPAVDPWPLSLLVGGGDPTALSATLARQTAAVTDFQDGFSGQAMVSALEAPLPKGLDGKGLQAYLQKLVDGLAAGHLADVPLYLEVPALGDGHETLAYLTALADFPGRDGLGAKLRCGGVTAEAFPSVAQVAAVIHGTAELGLALKFTAGLHHPVRHLADTPPVMMHGFLNVFVAALLARADNASLETLTAIVGETDPTRFSFSGDDLGWLGHGVAVGKISALRAAALPGFGSCSFTEPRADLTTLNLL